MPQDDLQQHQLDLESTLDEVIELLNKQALVNNLAQRSASHRHVLVQSLVEKQQLNAVVRKVIKLHPADIAFVLEGLALTQRQLIWNQLDSALQGAILLELNDAVAESLIGKMQRDEIINIAAHLDSAQLVGLMMFLSKDMALDLLNATHGKSREQVQASLSFPKHSVGALMDFDMVSVRDSLDLKSTLDLLKKNQTFPDKSDQLFVVDNAGQFSGVLSIKDLIMHDSDTMVSAVMDKSAFTLHTHDSLKEAASAFERYDLITVPVMNLHGQLVGSLNVERIVEYMDELSQKERLNQVGLSDDEDLYAPAWESAKNRWLWLGLNLATAFVASRVIGLFEVTINQLVALATLMPIIASIGGNTGNQTVALMVRGLAMKQISKHNFKRFWLKEMSISLINGVIWGAVVALFAFIMYGQYQLALVMLTAMIVNLLIAAAAGVLVPALLKYVGRDPVMGSSVLLTAITDSMGFFVFLGLAAIFLV